MYRVDLSWSEVFRAAQHAVSLQLNCLKRKARSITDGWDFDTNVLAMCAEKAVAKTLGLYWHDQLEMPPQGAPDVGTNIQVRAIRKPTYRLIVRTYDRDDQFVFLVYSEVLPTFYILGWIPVPEARRPEWLTDAGNAADPAYFVPQENLRSMDEFIKGELNRG